MDPSSDAAASTPVRKPSRRAVVAIALLAVALGLLVEHVAGSWLQPAYIPILDLGIGWLLVGCGLAAASARPGQPVGGRLVLAGFAWLVGTFMGGADGSMERLFGFAFGGYYDLILVWLGLSFPGSWPAGRTARWTLAVVAGMYVAQSIARIMLSLPETLQISLVEPTLAMDLVLWLDVARGTTVLGAGLLMLVELAHARGGERRLLAPVLFAAAVSSIVAFANTRYAMTVLGFIPDLGEAIVVPATWALNVVHVVVPLTILYGVLGLRRARGAIASVVAEVGQAPSVVALRAALATALRDDDLRILVQTPQARGYSDTDGRPVALEEIQDLRESRTQGVVSVDLGPDSLALIVLARSSAEDPALLDAAVSLTRLVVRNVQQAARIQEQLEEVRASRARIVEAADGERRRIERDLHDGLQQRMVALAMELRAAEGGEDRDAALRRGSGEILELLEDVRELARGIHPAVLTEAGLAAAIRGAADRSPVPAEVALQLDGRGSPAAQATAYFVVSEALANIAKHAAAATGVWIRADDSGARIRVEIEDDGPGGADLHGHGLAGLADRVAALGGTFAVRPGTAGGTMVVAEVPT